MVVGFNRAAEDHFAARILRSRHFAHELQRRLAEQRRVDAVANEWSSQRDRASSVAGWGRMRGEVARKHRGARNKSGFVRKVLTHRRSLITGEEDQLVFRNRPADRAAELIALDRVAARSKCVARVEHSIPNEFEKVTVNFVRSGLGHKADGTCRLHAFVRGGSAGFKLELLQGIWKRHGEVAVV